MFFSFESNILDVALIDLLIKLNLTNAKVINYL